MIGIYKRDEEEIRNMIKTGQIFDKIWRDILKEKIFLPIGNEHIHKFWYISRIYWYRDIQRNLGDLKSRRQGKSSLPEGVSLFSFYMFFLHFVDESNINILDSFKNP